MSETAETLRNALLELMQAIGRRAKEAWYGNAIAAFDTLMSEHRAEVETLTRNLADAQKDAHENAGAVSSARDAALEEARVAAKSAEYDHDPTVTRRNSLEAICALKSQFVRQYVDAEKVREVLVKWKMHPCSGDAGTCQQIAYDLGIDLDADAQG